MAAVFGRAVAACSIKPMTAGGERLEVAADLVYFDDEVGLFDCAIRSLDQVIVEARLIAAEPRDAASMLGRQDRMDDG